MPDGVAGASDVVRAEWRQRIAAEYGSAALTQHLVLWLMQAGAPPDLIADGLAIVSDELAHSQLSHAAYVAAGGTEPPAIDGHALGLHRTADLLGDILLVCARSFCLGETVAVPLFAHMRQPCRVPPAREALDRIVRDEVRHRDFGWDLLDWLCGVMPDAPARVTAQLPAMLGDLARVYGEANPVIAADRGVLTEAERAWGVALPREYAEIFARTIERDYRPRFAARGITF